VICEFTIVIFADHLMRAGGFVAIEEEFVTDWAVQLVWYLVRIQLADDLAQGGGASIVTMLDWVIWKTMD
jgi:hypothetical protein